MNYKNSYQDFIDEGSRLLDETQSLLSDYQINKQTFFSGPNSTNLGSDYSELWKLDNVIDDYNNWKHNIVKFLAKEPQAQNAHFSFSQNDGIPQKYQLTNLTRETYLELGSILKNELKTKTKILNELKNLHDKTEKIILLINREKMTVQREDTNIKYTFSIRNGQNKRFGYLIKIIQESNVSGEELKDYNNTGSLQNVSKEIKKINTTLNKMLNLTNDIIINPNHSGYEISEKYILKLI